MSNTPMITLEQARELVALLEQGQQTQADMLLGSINSGADRLSTELFAEVGKLTRQLHDALNDFHLDPRLGALATEDIPDAKQRLSYVIAKTEEAANRTMDAVEASLPLADNLHSRIRAVLPNWEKLMSRSLGIGEFKALCHELDALLKASDQDSEKLRELMTEVLMAQDFQDLTGQVIRRVIDLVREVEESLINLVKVFGAPVKQGKIETTKVDQVVLADAMRAEGPVVDSVNRNSVVSGQDEVDDLLSSLGF